MKVRISIVIDPTDILGAMLALKDIKAHDFNIEPVWDGPRRREAIKRAIKKITAKRKRGRPRKPVASVPDRVIAAVRRFQNVGAHGAPLKAIRKEVKSTSVSPVITDLIKHKKLLRTKPSYYKLAA